MSCAKLRSSEIGDVRVIKIVCGFGCAALLLSACAGPNAGKDLPRGASAYGVVPATQPDAAQAEYRIGPLDTIDITVFQEPDLSTKGIQVDASGNVAVPLAGKLQAAGSTASELATAIEAKLGERYLQHPQVTVTVSGSVSQKVIVEGEVTEPGVYPIHGSTTLLEALSLAKGETRVSSLKEVLVFRTVNGQRTGAVFDVSRIRRGTAQDPQILGNDVVVVGYSNVRGLWRDFLQTTPLIAVLRPFG